MVTTQGSQHVLEGAGRILDAKIFMHPLLDFGPNARCVQVESFEEGSECLHLRIRQDDHSVVRSCRENLRALLSTNEL